MHQVARKQHSGRGTRALSYMLPNLKEGLSTVEVSVGQLGRGDGQMRGDCHEKPSVSCSFWAASTLIPVTAKMIFP